MIKKWICIIFAIVTGATAQTVLLEDSFDGTTVNSAWRKYLNSPITVSDGKVNLSNGNAVNTAHRAFICRKTSSSGGDMTDGAKVFNFFHHGLQIDAVLGKLSGSVSAPARIAYYVGIAFDNAENEMVPGRSAAGIFFQIEKISDNAYRIVTTQQGGRNSEVTYIGKLSGAPSGMSVTVKGNQWNLSLTGAVFTDGANNRKAEAGGSFSLAEADFKDFYFVAGCMHLGNVNAPGEMELDRISVKKIPLEKVSSSQEKPVSSSRQEKTGIQIQKEPAILTADWPRAFFFRAAENHAANPRISYERWESTYNRLLGIMGKALDEEITGRQLRNPEFFSSLKKNDPEQIVLLHYNGNSRHPSHDIEGFFPGHWIYYEAASILSDIPAESGITEIRVSDTKHFNTGIGRFSDSTSDIGLFGIKDGKHDWQYCEYVKLISVDHENGTIRVERGCFGTKPLEFRAQKSRAAAIMTEGPWHSGGAMLWFYNLSSECPRDPAGKNCADALAADLSEKFGKNGILAAFDGLEFDVAVNDNDGDMDGDGAAENGIINGINTYAIGTIEFYKKLRAGLGNNRLILADGVCGMNQRGFGILNGIESEGWPHHPDREVKGWSGGLNRHLFWNREAAAPVFNYINHRFTNKSGTTNQEKYQPVMPFSIHRLTFAAAQFMDAALCFSSFPDPEDGELTGIWDELKKGNENKQGWLGKPVTPAVHLAKETPDILKNIKTPVPKIQDGKQIFTYKITAPADELVVFARVSAAPLKGYPEAYARLMEAWLGDETHGREKSLGAERLAQPMTWVNSKPFDAVFYFRNITNKQISLELEIEGTEPVTIHSISAHAAPDVMYRVYDNGLVLANPSYTSSYTFDLAKLAGGKSYRRLQASSKQDVEVNNGAPAGNSVTLNPLDGLFLVLDGQK